MRTARLCGETQRLMLPAETGGRSAMHDIVIRGGTILDGTGAEAFTGDVAIDGATIAQVGGKAGPGEARDRRGRPLGHARLGRCAHPLRRTGHLGPGAGPVLLARRDDDPVRQLRRRLRAGAPRAPRRPDRPDGGDRGHSRHRARRRPAMGLGELSRIPRRARPHAAHDRYRGADPASPAAGVRDGRARHQPRSRDRRRTSPRCAG